MPFREFDFIQSLPTESHVMLQKGIGDDAAVFGEKDRWLISTDTLVKDVHFNANDDPVLIGRKLAAVNISDMAAMGAEPLFFLFNAQVNKKLSEEWWNKLVEGLLKHLEQFQVKLIGGDTVVSSDESLTLTGTVLGKCFCESPVYRSGAKPGDLICVTGHGLGGSYPDRHLQFEPRVEWSRAICERLKPTAMIDISDGLLQDLGHILDSSSVGARLQLWKIPIAEHIRELDGALERALSDGEDFELLFTIAPEQKNNLPESVVVQIIGEVDDQAGKLVAARHSEDDFIDIERGGYSHDIAE